MTGGKHHTEILSKSPTLDNRNNTAYRKDFDLLIISLDHAELFFVDDDLDTKKHAWSVDTSPL